MSVVTGGSIPHEQVLFHAAQASGFSFHDHMVETMGSGNFYIGDRTEYPFEESNELPSDFYEYLEDLNPTQLAILKREIEKRMEDEQI